MFWANWANSLGRAVSAVIRFVGAAAIWLVRGLWALIRKIGGAGLWLLVRLWTLAGTLASGVATIWKKVWKWFLYTVIAGAFAPVALLYFALYLVHGGHAQPFSEVVGHGELLLIAGVLTIGELRLGRLVRTTPGEVMFVSSLLIVVFSLLGWATIVAQQSVHPGELLGVSEVFGVVVLTVALFNGAASRVLTEGGAEE